MLAVDLSRCVLSGSHEEFLAEWDEARNKQSKRTLRVTVYL